MAQNGGVSREHRKSTPEKFGFLLLHLTVIAACAWIALFGGWEQIGDWFGREWRLSDPVRAWVLLFCAAVYFLRHGVTLFYLLVRSVAWSEVFGLVAFMAVFEIGFLVIGGGGYRTSAIAFGPFDGLGIAMFIAGSWLNTWSEIQRKLWKQDPANKGKCYTGGLFRHSMHINYFGDVVLFTGWCLLTREPWTLLLPVFMASMFAFVHIPALDAYLADRYGNAFADYARKTKKLVPYVW